MDTCNKSFSARAFFIGVVAGMWAEHGFLYNPLLSAVFIWIPALVLPISFVFRRVHIIREDAFVSATKLATIIRKQMSLRMAELGKNTSLFEKAGLGNCHFSINIFQFIDNYLRLNVGETIFSKGRDVQLLENGKKRDCAGDITTRRRI